MFSLHCGLMIWAMISGPTVAADSPQDAKGADSIAKATVADLSQWVTHYYRQPDPENIPARVRRMVELNMLRKGRPEANQMFVGQIMRANPEKIADWMSAWKDLPAEDQAVLRQAVWISQTAAGKTWLAENGYNELSQKEGHPFTTGAAMVLEPYHVDMLWEWFFATGDKDPILRIVGMFNMLAEDPGAADLPVKPMPGGDRATYLRQTIGGVSVWSASSLAARHDKLLEHLKEIQNHPELPQRGGAWLKRAIELAERDRKRAD